LRRTTKYTVFDYTINGDILRELKTQLLLGNKLQSIKINGYSMLRESTIHISVLYYEMTTSRKRNTGRLIKENLRF